jgi:hypothetical protein
LAAELNPPRKKYAVLVQEKHSVRVSKEWENQTEFTFKIIGHAKILVEKQIIAKISEPNIIAPSREHNK